MTDLESGIVTQCVAPVFSSLALIPMKGILKTGVGGMEISLQVLQRLSFYYLTSLCQGSPTKWRVPHFSTSCQH